MEFLWENWITDVSAIDSDKRLQISTEPHKVNISEDRNYLGCLQTSLKFAECRSNQIWTCVLF